MCATIYVHILHTFEFSRALLYYFFSFKCIPNAYLQGFWPTNVLKAILVFSFLVLCYLAVLYRRDCCVLFYKSFILYFKKKNVKIFCRSYFEEFYLYHHYFFFDQINHLTLH